MASKFISTSPFPIIIERVAPSIKRCGEVESEKVRLEILLTLLNPEEILRMPQLRHSHVATSGNKLSCLNHVAYEPANIVEPQT